MSNNSQQHQMLPSPIHDESSRQDFVRDFRYHLSTSVYPGNFLAYKERVAPTFHKTNGRPPDNRHEVRKVMTRDPYYQMWSAMQRNSQELMWDAVIDTVERELPDLIEKSKSKSNSKSKLGSLALNSALEIPSYLTSYDIHLHPGSYHLEMMEGDVAAGAIYDTSLPIYAMGSLGPLNDDLGWTTVDHYVSRYPKREPARVLDMGCTIGHSTLPWAQHFPEADVHAIDVGAACLRYAHARAHTLDVTVHFSQQNAEFTKFEANSFDVITSHFFMHETSRSALPNIFAECYRILKPGGVMLHLDLEQDHDLDALTSFLMEWEVYNNNESFMGQLRSLDLPAIALTAGFPQDKVERAVQASRMSKAASAQTEDGYVNFFSWPIFVAEK